MSRLERFIIFGLCLTLIVGIVYAPIWRSPHMPNEKTAFESALVKVKCGGAHNDYIACWDTKMERFLPTCFVSSGIGLVVEDDSHPCYEDGMGVITFKEYKEQMRRNHVR